MKECFSLLFLIVCLSTNIYCQTGPCPNINHEGFKTIVQTTSTETITREYIIYVPANYNFNEPTPLVINLHGFGDCASFFAETVGDYYRFNELADQENILVAYPQGAYRQEKEDYYWEPGDNGVNNIYENDVYFMEQLVENISNEFNVNLDKVYACGYSNGGMMAYSLACNSSELFAGIGIMSGALLDDNCTLQNPVPIIKFHGVADEVLPYDGSVWYQSVAEVVRFWLDRNQIPENNIRTEMLNDGNVVRDEYFGDNSCFTLYTIHEEFDKPGDHVWFSDEIDGVSPNKIMWDFLNESCSSLSSSVNILNEVSDLNIFPNPFSDRINITTNSSLIDQEYIIYDVNGTRLVSGKMNTETVKLKLESLPPNIYLLKIGNNIRKLLKLE